MKITKRQLRKIIREAIDVTNASTGEVMVFADDGDPAAANFTPDAPELAARNVMKRLGLTPLENMGDNLGDPGIEEIYLSAEDYAAMDAEIGGKRHKRKAKKELDRLNIDNLMTRLEDWASNAGAEYAADNPGVDGQDIARDLAQGAEYSFEKDEWEALLYTGPFDSPDDLYTYIADVIAQGSTLNERRMEPRMETDVFRIVTRALNQGPLTHQQLLANVLDAYPNTSDEDIDYHIDRLEDSGDIIFNPSLQKYQ